MGLYRRSAAAPAEEERSAVPLGGPVMSGDDGFNVSGVATGETAMQSIAVRSSVDLIASLASELPIDVFSGVGPSRQQHDIPEWLKDPGGDGNGLEDWIYQVGQSWLLRGNLYGDIVKRRGDVIATVSLYHPDDVTGWIEDGRPRWQVSGRTVTDPSRFLHRRVNPVPGRVRGLSPIAFHANTIGVSLTSTRYGLAWFRDGGVPGSLLTNELRALNDTQVENARRWFMAAFRGNREPGVLGKGWKYEKIQIAPEESQFLQTQGFTEAQCARMFGPGLAEVLGYESGGSLTYTNVESRSAHLLVYACNKWFRRIERLLGLFLPEPQYAKINRAALLQSTTLERFRAHESALRNRWKTVNQVREDEDMGPVTWGDEPNLTYTGLSLTGDDVDATGAEAPMPGGNQ